MKKNGNIFEQHGTNTLSLSSEETSSLVTSYLKIKVDTEAGRPKAQISFDIILPHDQEEQQLEQALRPGLQQNYLHSFQAYLHVRPLNSLKHNVD